jgi:hypothetical protein
MAFYRLRSVTATEESPRTMEIPASPGSESRRVAEARSRAAQRLSRQRDTLRPLGWAVILVVAAGTLDGHPAPGLHGEGIGVTLALCAFVVTLAAAISERFTARGYGSQAAVICAMGAAGAALARSSRVVRPSLPQVAQCGWRSPGCHWRLASRSAVR